MISTQNVSLRYGDRAIYLKMFLLNLQKVTVMELLVPMVLVNLHF
mgnify:CR=1 FL=1